MLSRVVTFYPYWMSCYGYIDEIWNVKSEGKNWAHRGRFLSPVFPLDKLRPGTISFFRIMVTPIVVFCGIFLFRLYLRTFYFVSLCRSTTGLTVSGIESSKNLSINRLGLSSLDNLSPTTGNWRVDRDCSEDVSENCKMDHGS